MGFLTGRKIVLEIAHPSTGDTVLLDLTYRWWTKDPDPWSARVPGMLAANSGTWLASPYTRLNATVSPPPSSAMKKGVHEIVVFNGTSIPTIIEDPEDNPFWKPGLSGDAEHRAKGGKIPGHWGFPGEPIRWVVKSVY